MDMLRKIPFAAIFFVKSVQAVAPSLPPHQTFECLKALREKGFLQAGIYHENEAFIFANTAVPPPALWVATPDAFRRAPLPTNADKTESLLDKTIRTYEFKVDGPQFNDPKDGVRKSKSYSIEAQLQTATPVQNTTQATPTFGFSFNPAAMQPLDILTLKSIGDTKNKSVGFEEVTPGAAEVFGTFFDGVMDAMKEKYLEEARKLESRHFAKQNDDLMKKNYLPLLKTCEAVPEFAQYTSKLKIFMSEATEESVKEH